MKDAVITERPQFRFDGVTSRVFPLRANLQALQRLCDGYLNLFPEQVWFRPSAPYVLVTLLHYGRMSYATQAASSVGWVSQNEVYFGVPLDWGRLEHGRWRPLGAGVVAPFIFVDQPWSLEEGREVFGWPKQPARFDHGGGTWASRSPSDREHLLTLATETFQTPYAGEPPRSVPLVEIDRAAPLGIASRLWQAPLVLDNPWWGALTWWREAMRLWSSSPIGELAAHLARIGQALRQRGASPWFYTANLKQVRSVEDPAVAAYQAITMAPVRLSALTRAGALGEGRIALGDPTGGYRIRIHRHPLFPIVETLGLIVSDEDHRPDGRGAAIRGVTAGVAGNTRLEPFPAGLSAQDERGHGVVTVAPLLPFWLEASLDYGQGDTLSWRSPHRGDGAWHRRNTGGGARTWVASAAPGAAGGRAAYAATWGARAVPAPPYYYPQLTMRLLPLPATPQLADVVASWQLPREVGTFRLLAPERPHVLMMVTTSEEMSAQVNDAGWWWKRQVAFFVPVIWTRNGLDLVVLASVVTFSDGQLAAATARDTGPDVIAAELCAPPDSWLDDTGPAADRRLLWLATTVLPALEVDAEARQRVLLEVLAPDPRGAEPAPRPSAGAPPGDLEICIVARRRIRDAVDPEAIAYDEWFSQNLVSRGAGQAAWQHGAAALELRIHQYPHRLDLVGRLALDVTRREHGKSARPGRGWEGTMVNILPTSCAWSTLDVTHESNTSLAVRSHGGPWTAPVRAPGATPPEPRVNAAFARLLAAFGPRLDRQRHG